MLLISNYAEKLEAYSPSNRISTLKEKIMINQSQLDASLDSIINNNYNLCKNSKIDLDRYINIYVSNKSQLIDLYKSKIEVFNPKLIEEKGYVQIIKDKKKIKSNKLLKSSDEVEIVFLDGSKEAIIK